MAEKIMATILKQTNDISEVNVEVDSAGIDAHEGETAEKFAIEVLRKRGISLENHRAEHVKSKNLEEIDLILTMEAKHRDIMTENYMSNPEMTFLLTEFVGEEGNIEDCWGHERKVYEQCVEKLEELIVKVIMKIKKE